MGDITRSQLDFVTNAIKDTQDTIRAYDRKLTIAAGILILPLAKLDSIFAILQKLSQSSSFFYILAALFVLCWIFGSAATMMGLIGIDNPVHHVEKTGALGLFFHPPPFAPDPLDLVLNRKSDEAKFSVATHEIPRSEEGLLNELCFEHSKLAYIRTMKAHRSNAAAYLLAGWIACGAMIWLETL